MHLIIADVAQMIHFAMHWIIGDLAQMIHFAMHWIMGDLHLAELWNMLQAFIGEMGVYEVRVRGDV